MTDAQYHELLREVQEAKNVAKDARSVSWLIWFVVVIPPIAVWLLV